MTDNERLADLLFGSNGLTPEDCELRFPPRELPEGARVTRFSPSPTGYLHIGGLFGALVDFLTARISGGLTYLRIEDTDKKREVTDGVSGILEGFRAFGIDFDEGVVYVDGQALEEDYIREPTYLDEGLAFPITVPEGCIFLLGDNRNNSMDSRDPSLGPVDVRCVIGKAVALVFPGKSAETGKHEFSRIGGL